MNREDVRKLLGGYATDTLTPAEQEALFTAALQDQELFDAIAAEQPLRDVLSDPAVKANLLANLDSGKPRRRSWRWAAALALTGLAAVTVVTVEVRETGTGGQGQGRLTAARAPGAGGGDGDLAVAENAEDSSVAGRSPTTVRPMDSGSPPAVRKKGTRQSKLGHSQVAAVRGRTADEVGQVKVKTGRRDLIAGVPPAEPAVIGGAPPAVPAITGEPPITTAPPAVAETRIPQPVAPATAPPPVTFFQEQAKTQASGSQALAEPPRLPRTFTRTAGLGGAAAGALASTSLPLQITVLRASGEAPAGLVLDTGETVRLRMIPPFDGSIVVQEGGKDLVTAKVQGSKPYTTPELPFQGSGRRSLQIRFSSSQPGQALTVPLALTYQ